ncbi:MAG TPA: cytochrome c oxidase assembly protein [Solirubrobacterales bacterium]|jgi:cytochrome c oxidase assembly factor CtaG|nr:cytochrome c oxidase assembly protein [Solirubrobacterales bacterium]
MNPVLAHVGGGTLEPLQLIAVTAVAYAYWRRARTLAREGRPVPAWRVACFAAGIVLITAGLVSPLAHMGEELLLAHMAQHLLVGDIAALLIVLGLTGPLLQPLLAIKAIDRLRVLTHPLVALPLWAASLYIWHIPALYQAALTNEPVHALQHACFIGFGILMWMPLLGPLPQPRWFGIGAKLGYVVAVRFAGAVLGNVFMWSNTVFYPDYAPGEADFGISPLSDQGTAGVIMTVEGGLVTLGVLCWLFLLWAEQDTERQRLVELAEERGVELSPERAERAVRAGQGARLEERIKGST